MKLITLAEKYNYTCYYCKQKFPLSCLSRDHYFPARKGKVRSAGSFAERKIVLACKACNCAKADKIPALFIKKKREPTDEELDNYFSKLYDKNNTF